MEYILRSALISDYKEIYELESKIFSFPHTLDQMQRVLNDSHYIYYIVEKNDKIIGYCGLQSIEDEGYITNIAVDQNYRCNGIADILINKTIDKSKELGLSFISLEVRESNTPAINLYKKHNFKIINILPAYYQKPTENGLIMTLRY